MAYTLNTEFNSFPVNAYFKITRVEIHDYVTYDEKGQVIIPNTKTFVANITIQMYKDASKKVVLGLPDTKGLIDLPESALTLPGLYALIKPEGAVDA